MMNEQEIREKLAGMKKTRKTLSALALTAALVAIAALIAYNLLGVVFCQNEAFGQTLAACDFAKGYTFPGWQVIFWGMGNQYIMGGQLFDPSPLGIAAMVGTLLVLIICLALRNKGKNKSKAVKEFLSAACLAYSAVILGFCIAPVALMTATNNLSQFRSNVLDVPGTVFTGTAIAVVIGVVLLVCAAVKCCYGLFLLKQKKLAAQLPKNPQK